MATSKLRLALVLGLAAALSSCSDSGPSGTFVLVKVEAGDAPSGIKRLDFALTMGARMRTHMLTKSGGQDITPPTEAGFEIDMGTGPLSAVVTARDGAGAPLAEGMGSVIVESNKTVSMVVTLARPGAILALDKTSHDFGNVVIGMNSMTSFRVTNTGSVASGQLATTITGSGFSALADGCAGQTLAAAAGCTIDVAFAPGAAARATGTLSIQGTPGGTVQASLTGMGLQSGSLTITPASQNFGSVVRLMSSPEVTFTVANPAGVSTGALAVGLTGTDTAHFTITMDGCTGMVLAPISGSCAIKARFNPMMPGTKTATLSVTGDPGGTAVAPLSGTGVPPGTLTITPPTHDFGAVVMGMMSATQVFTVTNPGGSATSALTSAVSDSANFSIVADTCTGPLASGASCMVTARFNPVATGGLVGSLTVSATTGGTAAAAVIGQGLSVATLEVTPGSTNFGPVVVNGQSATVDFTVLNTGGAMSGMVSANLADSTNFTISANTCTGAGLAAAAACAVTVRFNPRSAGALSTMLTVSATPGGTNTVQLMGMGQDPGSLMVTPTSHSFGSRGLGSSTSTTLTLTNSGGAATGAPTAILSDTTNYRIMANGCTTALAGGASCMLTIAFTPTLVGSLSGSLSIMATPGGTVPVSFSGTGTADVTVQTQGAGSGTVTSSPSQISCNPTCTGTFSASTIQLIATPANAGSVFSNWLGDCAGQGATCNLSLAANRSATAVFARAPGPTINIFTPAASTTTGRDTSVTWSVQAGATYVCYLDTGTPGSCTSPAALMGLTGGTHTFHVTGTDSFGNTGPEASRSWTVDALGPPVAIGTPTSGSTTSASVNVTWNEEGGATYSCRLDGGSAAPCSSGSTLGPLPAGSHMYSVTGTDMFGNVGSPAIVNFTVSTFEPGVMYAAGTNPFGIASGDLNGDGRLDLAVANVTSNDVSVLMQSATAKGTFLAPVTYATGAGASAVAIGDLNGDGKLDLAVANENAVNISVLLQNPGVAGSFNAAVNYPTDSVPLNLAIADVNGDGRIDLVAANGIGRVSVLLQSGTTAGTFLPFVSYATGSGPCYSVAVGDLNGDGRRDLAVANQTSNNVSVLLQSATTAGTFGAAVNYATGMSPTSVAIGDLNGDGKPDLATANAGVDSVSVLMQNAATPGTFAAPVSYTAGTGPRFVAIVDINSDGRLDLAVANQNSNTVSVLLQNTASPGNFLAGTLFNTFSTPYALAPADLNGDGRLDLAVACVNTQVVILLQNAPATPVPGTYNPAVNYGAGAVPSAVAIGDLNDDGRLDLAIANRDTNNVSVLLQSATTRGSFLAAVNYAASLGPIAIAIADLNMDGRLDLAVANQANSNVSVLLQSGSTRGVFLSAVNYPAVSGSAAMGVAIGDLNGDGRPDLAVTNNGVTGTVSVLLQSTITAGTFQAAVNYTVGDGPRPVAIADLNRDGRPDLVVGNTGAGGISVLLQSGTTRGVFLSAVSYTAGTGPEGVAIGDLNADGRLDIAVANSSSGNISILLQNTASPGTFASPVNIANGATRALVVADLNLDGRLDLATVDFSDFSTHLQNPAAPGTFLAGVSYNAGTGPTKIAVGDLNNDGHPDLAVVNQNSNDVSVALAR